MSQVAQSNVRLTIDLWHPNCWAIQATSQTSGGILAHAIYNSPTIEKDTPRTVKGLFTAFGETTAEVEALLNAIEESEHSGALFELQERFGRERDAPGSVVSEFFLEYDPNEMVCPTLLANGLVHSAPAQIQDGSEKWNLCFTGEREQLDDALDNVREQANAEITVASITTSESKPHAAHNQRHDMLTPAQREVFEYARENGYYEWPRQTTTRELADELNIAKSTLLEHLRKAESTLLDPE